MAAKAKPKNRPRYFSWVLVKAGRIWATCKCECGSTRRFRLSTWNAGSHLSFRCMDCSIKQSNKIHTWLFYKPTKGETRDCN